MTNWLPETASRIERRAMSVVDVERFVLFIVFTIGVVVQSNYAGARLYRGATGAKHLATTVPVALERWKCKLVLDLTVSPLRWLLRRRRSDRSG